MMSAEGNGAPEKRMPEMTVATYTHAYTDDTVILCDDHVADHKYPLGAVVVGQMGSRCCQVCEHASLTAAGMVSEGEYTVSMLLDRRFKALPAGGPVRSDWLWQPADAEWIAKEADMPLEQVNEILSRK